MPRKVRALAMLMAACLAGCQNTRPVLSPDPGVTGYAHVNGYAVQRYIYPMHLVRRAAVEAMQDMRMHAMKETCPDDNSGFVYCGFLYDGRLAKIEVAKAGEEAAIVTVRFDLYGDEPLSKIFLDRVSVRLSTLPNEVNPANVPRALSDSALHRGQDISGYRGAPLR